MKKTYLIGIILAVLVLAAMAIPLVYGHTRLSGWE